MPSYDRPTGDRRTDDEWRGQIAARVKSIEERLIGQDARSEILGNSITSIRIDMSVIRTEQAAVREDIKEINTAIKEDAQARVQESKDFAKNLQDTLRQKGLNTFQWVLLATMAVLTAIIGPLVVAALTGNLG